MEYLIGAGVLFGIFFAYGFMQQSKL